MMPFIAWLAALAGGVLLYLASPNQKLAARRPGDALAGWAGGAALVLALVLMLLWAGPATAFFIVATIAMLVLTILPVAAAWLRRTGSRTR